MAAHYPVRAPRARVAASTARLARGARRLTPTFLSFPPRAQDVPTATQRVQARRFFDALGDLYPCATCRADFRVDSRASPPRVDSRASLSRWVCERHNEVNAKLGGEERDEIGVMRDQDVDVPHRVVLDQVCEAHL